MAGESIYVSRVVRLPLLDADGATIGRIDDVVIAPPYLQQAPRVLGFVASVQRRRIFVNGARVGEVSQDGVRLHSGTIDLRHFELRAGEMLAVAGIFGRRLGDGTVTDLGLRAARHELRAWEVSSVAVTERGRGRIRRGHIRILEWTDAASLFDVGPVAHEIATFREMHPSDVAQRVRLLPLERRRQLAEVMEDERLADLLEELDEEEQLRIIEGLDLERVAHVLEEMDPDDAADLLAEMPAEQQVRLLQEMDPDEARPLRRLLTYGEKTAGGLMTPEPVVVQPETTVAEALARLREADVPPALAAQVFVTRPPTTTPTGPFLGAVGFQRLLREPPGMQVGRCVDDEPEAVPADVHEARVALRLAAYDLLAVAVVDNAGRLLGAVTVDDMLDHLLPENWRQRAR